jgi:predicted membrane-bound spermidine synthase
MLGPILGGTTFTFGLILAVALAGIGVGGAMYPFLYRGRAPTLNDFALTCGWEALAIAIPFALGDRVALLAHVAGGLRYFGFGGQALGWAIVAIVVLLPAAVVSGIQFPLLIALLGRGGRDVGKHVGQAYAWNTVGAMLGSLAGGFGLLPLLTATGAWKLVIVLLGLLALAVLLAAYREAKAQGVSTLHPVAATAAAAACLFAMGPTAVWRHSGIGAGRAKPPSAASANRNEILDWINQCRRNIQWEADGSEVGVGIATSAGVAFIVSGKSDGNALNDAPTQIMFPVTAAMLHTNPRETMVVGLGTGESAGWLASLPDVERVDCVELEPAIAEVARLVAPLNHNVLEHPKVRLSFNDAREALQTTRNRYDVIMSVPSNPYRAGVATLFTLDFYHSARDRLKPGGIFAQWMQGYEIDVPTFRIVLTTLRRAFEHVEVWEMKPGDMMLVCSMERPKYDLAQLRARLALPAYRQAVRVGWRTTQVEGVLAHFLANENFVTSVAQREGSPANTDNRNLLEYGFARTVGLGLGFSTFGLREEARSYGMHRPTAIQTGVDWETVEDRIVDYNGAIGDAPIGPQFYAGPRQARAQAVLDLFHYSGAQVIQHWESLQKPPEDYTEVFALAFAYAQFGDEKAGPLIEKVREICPTEALLLDALLIHQQDRYADAAERLSEAFLALRADPTVTPWLGEPICRLAIQIVESDRKQAAKLYQALEQPFCVYWGEEQRRFTRYLIGKHVGAQELAAAVIAFEPHVPWDAQFLPARLQAYEAVNHPLTYVARRDWDTYRRWVPEIRVRSQ